MDGLPPIKKVGASFKVPPIKRIDQNRIVGDQNRGFCDQTVFVAICWRSKYIFWRSKRATFSIKLQFLAIKFLFAIPWRSKSKLWRSNRTFDGRASTNPVYGGTSNRARSTRHRPFFNPCLEVPPRKKGRKEKGGSLILQCRIPRASNHNFFRSSKKDGNSGTMIKKRLEFDLGSAFFGISEVDFLPYGVQMKVGIFEN